jgi:hypothetical protein
MYDREMTFRALCCAEGSPSREITGMQPSDTQAASVLTMTSKGAPTTAIPRAGDERDG